MPVSKRRPHGTWCTPLLLPYPSLTPTVSEILNVAVAQQRKLREAAAEILERPASIWLARAEDSGGQRGRAGDEGAEELSLLERALALAPDRLVLLSRLCEKALGSRPALLTRLVLSPVGFFVLAYQVPQTDLAVNGPADLAVLYLDLLVNVVYLAQSALRVGGSLIRAKVELAFHRELTLPQTLRQSGLPAVAVTVLCFVFGFASPAGLWIRLVRLSFIASSILEVLPHVDVLMSGLSNGIRTTVFTVLLLFLVILFYGSVGHCLFAENDPFDFGTYPLACLTFFVMTTFENWSTVWYLNFGGCDSYPSVYTGAVNASSVATVFGSFDLPFCSQPAASPVASSLLFVTYVIVGGYVCVNITLASVAIGISERLDELRSLELFGGEELEMRARSVRRRNEPEAGKALRMMGGEGQRARVREFARLVRAVWAPPGSPPVDRVNSRPRPSSGSRRILERVRAVVGSKPAQITSTLLILGDALLEAAALSTADTPGTYSAHLLFTSLLSLRAVLSVLSDEAPTSLLADGWTQFDVATLALLWVPSMSLDQGSTRFLGAVRVVRLVLVARFLSFISDLDVIIRAVTSSFVSTVYCFLIMLLFFYYFAAAGVLLFKAADPYHFGSFQDALRTLLEVMTLDNWSEIMRTCMLGCRYFGYNTGVPSYDGLCGTKGEGSGVGWWAAIYFVCFVIASAMVLVSMLIGVIITSMELLREEFRENEDIWARMDAIQVAYELTDDNVEALLALFERIDVNSNGHLTFHELGDMFLVFNMPEETQFEFYMRVDRDSSGQIDFCEFCEMMTLIQRATVEVKDIPRELSVRMPSKKLRHKKSSRSSLASNDKDDDVETANAEFIRKKRQHLRKALSGAVGIDAKYSRLQVSDDGLVVLQPEEGEGKAEDAPDSEGVLRFVGRNSKRHLELLQPPASGKGV